jgi:NAD(P)-dependent dehydrogenase (short-subunit alcohol dehydrogenase family)
VAKSNEQRTIFITGAGSGIGRATAQLFAARGWFVGLADIDQSGLEETAALLPEGQRVSVLLDVRDRTAWTRAIQAFSEATGRRMDVLFNNAGIGRGGWFEDMAADDIDLVVDVNIKGVIYGVEAALPLLKETPRSCILNTASVAGLCGTPRMAVYSASKFAVRGLTDALSIEFERHGVRVASLAPWFIDTAILDNTGGPNANRTLRDDLRDNQVQVYPVEMAAQRAWDAVHGKDTHYMVGKLAERTWFGARFFPNATRAHLRKTLPSG